MSKPHIHALASVRRWKGKVEDYISIHAFMDSSKSIVADNKHRMFTHNSWFISVVIPAVFGETFENSDGKVISSRDVAEWHCLEDYHGFIPSANDFLDLVEYQDWFHGQGNPPKSAINKRKVKSIKTVHLND